MDRREFLKAAAMTTAGALLTRHWRPSGMAGENSSAADDDAKASVYFTRDLSAAGLKKAYQRVNANIGGRIAVKLHTGEPGGPYILPRDWVREVMALMPGASIVETNAFYDSPRQTTEGHRAVLKQNGWTFAPVDIMDADGDVDLPVPGGKWFERVAMGKNIVNYDSMAVLTHFKGHTVGGFGGSLKNIAIGCASGKVGKKQLHQKGDEQWGHTRERFMEHMAESGKAVQQHFGGRMAFVNVFNNMSVDCDCTGVAAAKPTAPDIGIVASTDLLAVDQASIDLVYALAAEQRKHLVERIESRKGLRQLEYMDEMKMGSRRYELVNLD